MKTSTRFRPGVSGNESSKWKPGQSGNPAGKSKRRLQFEELFIEALVTEGSAEEAASLLWKAARAGEPWAIQNLCQRFAPQTQSLRMIHETEYGELDYTKLSDEQLRQLESIVEQAGGQPTPIESREGPTKPV